MPPKVGQKFQKVINHHGSKDGQRTAYRTILEVGKGYVMYEDENGGRAIIATPRWNWWVKGAIALEPDAST